MYKYIEYTERKGGAKERGRNGGGEERTNEYVTDYAGCDACHVDGKKKKKRKTADTANIPRDGIYKLCVFVRQRAE